MQFPQSAIDHIVKDALEQGYTSASVVVNELRPYLAAAFAQARAAKSAGIKPAELANMSSKVYYAVGVARFGDAWEADLDPCEIQGLAEADGVMAEVLAQKFPDFHGVVNMADQRNSVYLGLSRSHKGSFQVIVRAEDVGRGLPPHWVDLFVFKTLREAELFKSEAQAKRQRTLVRGLVRGMKPV